MNAQAKRITTQMVTHLQTVLPDDYDIEAAGFGLALLSASYVGDWYRRTLVPVRSRVLARDESLLHEDWGEDAPVMDALKSVWSRLGPEDRAVVWAKLKVIVTILTPSDNTR